ncbi:uncharacterized protein LOC114599536 [Podarcis muralis]
MSSQNCSSSLSLKDVFENGFLIGASGYSISPGSSCFLEMSSIPQPDAYDSASKMQNVTKGSSLALKATDSSISSTKENLQASSDALASFCKTPIQPCAFDLSSSSSANDSKTNYTEGVFHNTKSSTPCREDNPSKPTTENMSKSSEINDVAVFKKPPPPPPILEISGIQATLGNVLSPEASLEEFGSPGSVKLDTPSLEMSNLAMPLGGGSAVSVTITRH